MNDKTIRELQSSLPWTAHYHRDFRATPLTHKDFAHALLHVHKAGGKLAAIIDDAEHGGVDFAASGPRAEIAKYLSDFVICALRMANTCPDGLIDLQAAVEGRIENKNNQISAQAVDHKAVEAPAYGLSYNWRVFHAHNPPPAGRRYIAGSGATVADDTP